MSILRLWAIGINDVRGIFGADPETADRLREAAAAHFGAAGRSQPGLLGKLGPFLRGGNDPVGPRPGTPSSEDVEDLLSGHYLAPHRLVPAWNLLEFWMTTSAIGVGEWPLTESGLNEFDFDLVRAQVPARYGLSDLFKANLGISLTRCPGLAAGWVRGQHALGMLEHWPAGIDELEDQHRELADHILDFLTSFAQWTHQARAEGRPDPDLVAVFHA
jgi:hypothetical protein